MRLRLSIQRHSLPPVQLLWTAGHVLSSFTPEPAAIISQLLEQVNEIIPLESEDWGLEDYVVEVHGYECLHFSELSHVLREDDEVRIRPLQTSDLRFRKVSGRHQISADGKHLIDGVAFGRPFLKRTERPPVIIPPRKRRRITYDEGSNEIFDEYANNQQTAVHAGLFDPNNGSLVEDSGVDDDYSPEEEEIRDLSIELKDLHNDECTNPEEDHIAVAEGVKLLLNQVEVDASARRSPRTSPRRSTRSRKAGGLGLGGEDMLKLVDENGRPYPGEYDNPVLDLYLDGDDETQRRRQRQRQPQSDRHGARPNKKNCTSDLRQKVEKTTQESNMQPERVIRGISNPGWKGVRFQEVQLETSATVRDFPDSDKSDQDDFHPSSDMTSDQDGSDKENSEPRYELPKSRAPLSHKHSIFLSTSSEMESQDEDGSFHSSETSTSSDADAEQSASGSKPAVGVEDGAVETWSSGLSSSSDHPGCEITEAFDALKNNKNVEISGKGSLKRSLPSVDNEKVEEIPAVSDFQAQHSRNLATRKRNQRRRDTTRLKRLIRRGVLWPNATLADYHRLQENRAIAKSLPGEQREQSQKEANDAHAAFEAKRECLLKAIASGGVDASRDAQEGSSLCQAMGDRALAKENALDDGRLTPIDERATISNGLPRNNQPDHTQSLLDHETVTPKSSIGLIGKVSSSLDEIEAPSDGVKSATDRVRAADEVSFVSDGILASRPDTAIETYQTGSQKLESHKRSRLDISSSRRMVFGSLGVKVPENKEDEAKLTAKFMKDVKPLQVLRTEEASQVSALSIPRSSDNWKDKIVLMAVECCEEGIELSNPPFPFKQRWDPQQRKTFNSGNNSRRGKKRKRNDDLHYVEGVDEDTFGWEASASFGKETSAAGESTGSPLEQQERKAARIENDEHEVVTNEKLQRASDSSAPASADGEGIQDLPNLPEDISTCLPLTETMTSPGTVIAFKQLDMSEKTNWQPKISDYRTAKVDCLMEDGTLRVKLAKRDRSHKEEHFDQHTGKRFYSKFEMPGFDDNREDSGLVEVSFSELIEPKLIQAAIFQPTSRQSSFHDDCHSPRDMATVMETNYQSSPASPTPTDLELPGAVFSDGGMAGANEGVRQEIFDLIKEAGWRSSIRSGNEDDQRSEQNSPTLQDRPLSQDQLVSQHVIYREEGNSEQCPSEQFNGFNSSPPGGEVWESSKQRSSEEFIAEPSRFNDVSEIAETVPIDHNTVPHTPTQISIGNSDDAVDMKEEAHQEPSVWSERQNQTEPDDQRSPQQPSSAKPPPASVVGSAQHDGSNEKSTSSPDRPASLHELSSENEFPTLENVFSQVRSSQAISQQARPSFDPRVSDDDLTYMAKSSFESTTTKERGPQKETPSKSQSSGEDKFTGKETLFKWEDSDERDQTTPRASQRTVQPQIVDLTIPSDPADAPGDSDYIDDGTQLPTGPGWVKKTRAISSRLGSMKPRERRSTRSRSRNLY